MKTDSAACTHVGQRNNNEDAHCVDPSIGLFAVADGMGGYEGGEVASRLAIDALTTAVRAAAWTPRTAYRPSPQSDEALVSAAMRSADAAITGRKTGRLAQMGSTLAAVVVRDRRALVAHVGDSRVYLLRSGELHALTRDHSLHNEMIDAGLANAFDLEGGQFAHIITRALGMGDKAAPDVATSDALPGDVFLVCSDGLYGPVPEDVIARYLGALSPQLACEALVHEAFSRGGSDNITAVIVRVLGDDE